MHQPVTHPEAWELQTSVILLGGETIARPMFGDAMLGEPDSKWQEIFEKATMHCATENGMVAPILNYMERDVLTPWGIAYGGQRGSWKMNLDPATGRLNMAYHAAMRAWSHGNFRLLGKQHAYWTIVNEGVEYGITSYTSGENFEPVIASAWLEAEAAINARNAHLEKIYGDADAEGLEIGVLTENDWGFINAAEEKKIAFCAITGNENEPFNVEEMG